VPNPPPDALPTGLVGLPLSVDRVFRLPTSNPWNVKTLVHSYVSLNDFNRDGLPDIVIAGSAAEPWSGGVETVLAGGVKERSWRIFLNTGAGFETTPSANLLSPIARTSDLEPASPLAAALDVPYPAMQATQTVGTVVGSQSRSVTETSAGMVDIDGDGIPEVARRIRILPKDPAQQKREGLLVWRRQGAGPQDTMLEDTYPLEGRRYLIEYKPASAFQWEHGRPTGEAPRHGHRSLAGVGGLLVRSVTTERLVGRTEQRTRAGYDYKAPYLDLTTRIPTGFALLTREALDPDTGAAIDGSLTVSQRSAQRPNGVPSVTHSRQFLAGSEAPVQETLTTSAESSPTAQGGVGGLRAVFSAPERVLTVDYPSSVTRGPVFDVGFDGREPFVDRVDGLTPRAPPMTGLDASAPTGGAARLATASDWLGYRSPHPRPDLDAVTVETWVKPDSPGSGTQVVVEQPGAYRLVISQTTGGSRWRFQVGAAAAVTSNAPISADVWQHVVATFGGGTAHIYVNGREVAFAPFSALQMPSGDLAIGCASGAGTSPIQCFSGEIGELRVYEQAWPRAPRVTETRSELQLANSARADFGRPLRVLARNDLVRADDDVVSEYTYASTASSPTVLGLVASEATRELRPDGTGGAYLGYTQHAYDGLPVGQAARGNETSTAKFDGPATTSAPPAPTQLRVKTTRQYDPACPGLVAKLTDPDGFTTATRWDPTCTVAVETRNALGHVSRTRYYGINGPPPQAFTGPYGTFPLQGHYGQTAESIDPNGGVTRTTYDEWGRPVASWLPLDRRDRPHTRFDYADAVCDWVSFSSNEPSSGPCGNQLALALRSPPRTTTLTWDDQLRRCEDGANRLVECSSSSAKTFADESSTGAYRVSYSFGDGQKHTQAVLAKPASLSPKHPAWSVGGVVDYDQLGRAIRTYRVQYLPSGCPPAGTWCDPAKAGDPLRRDAASTQTAYDALGRVTRIYGPTVPPCPASDPLGDPNCNAQPGQTPPVEVTHIRYPAPGVVETIDAKGVPTVVRSDSRGLATSVQKFLAPSTAPYAEVVTTYDRLGRLESETDPGGNVSHHRYDALSRLVASDDPDRGTTTYRYDLRSNLLEAIVATGEKTAHTYDELSRIARTDYLRPKAGPSHPVCCDLGGDSPPEWTPPELCHTVPGLESPVGDLHGVQLTCRGSQLMVKLPLEGLRARDSQLVLRYGVFGDCGGGRRGCNPAVLEVGVPNPAAPGGMQTITTLGPTPRPFPGQPRAARRAERGDDFDVVAISLPERFARKQPELLLAFHASGARRFLLDIAPIGAQAIAYEPEERVLRSYDTSEPSHYIRAGSMASGGDREQRPMLDFPLDVPSANLSGRVADRSPTGSVLRCKGRVADTEAVSGHGIVLQRGTRCAAAITLARAEPFTAELWLRPHDRPQRPQAVWSASKHLIVLQPNGRVRCGLGAQSTSSFGLPTDVWTHVALTYDGKLERCYVNGVAQTRAPGSGAAITTVQVAGGDMGIDVDEVRLLGEARNDVQVHEDALRPLAVGPPRGSLAEIDFAHPLGQGRQADQSKAGNDADVKGPIRPGIQGMAFETGKPGAVVRISHSPTLRLEDAVTAELWVKRRQGPHNHARLIGKWAGGPIPGWRLDLEAGSGRLRWEVVTQFLPATGPVQTRHEAFVTYEELADDRWYHIAGTYDGKRLRVFIDGVPAHRWCTSENPAAPPPCGDPPPPSECTVEARQVETAVGNRVLGDAVCVTGTITNEEPVLIANDTTGAALLGMVDEALISYL
jgi:YD repeat-containing protein